MKASRPYRGLKHHGGLTRRGGGEKERGGHGIPAVPRRGVEPVLERVTLLFKLFDIGKSPCVEGNELRGGRVRGGNR